MLAGSLREHERAILLTVYQYEITQPKLRQRSTHYEEVSVAVQAAVEKGMEAYEVSMRFEKDGVTLVSCQNTTHTL